MRKPLIPGTGLDVISYAALVAVSVALFFVWGGLLWRVPRSASHGMRFAVSYLAVVPLAAGVLAYRHRFRWSTLLAAVATVWGAKLVITALVFVPVVLNAPRIASAEAAGGGDGRRAPVAAGAGDAARATAHVGLAIGEHGYTVSFATVRDGGSVTVRAIDGRPHTVRPQADGTMATTLPLPPGGEVELVLEPGLHHLRCDHHPGEETWVRVVPTSEAPR